MLDIKELNIQINDISLEDITFQVKDGDFLGIFGPDDSGKTELLSCIMGLFSIRSGTILYNESRKLKKENRTSIRYIPDNILIEKITALAYLKFIMRAYKVKNTAYMKELAAYFNITLSRKLTYMTYEENKLVTIIAALLTNPKVLILDEPFNFLTDETHPKLMNLLEEKNKEGMTILISAEKYQFLEGYVHQFLYLKDGKIIQCGQTDEKIKDWKAVTIKGENSELLETTFGKPISTNDFGVTYACESCLGKLTFLLNQNKITEDDIFIEKMTAEAMLEASLKKTEIEKTDVGKIKTETTDVEKTKTENVDIEKKEEVL